VATVINLQDAGVFFAGLTKRRHALAVAGCKLAATRCLAAIQTIIIPSRNPPPVDRGIYRAGWKVEPLPNGAAYYNDSPIAAIVEFGARAANIKIGRKLLAALAEWVVRKGIGSKEESLSIAWAIAQKAKAGRGFHNQKPGGGLRIGKECDERFAERYMNEEVTRALMRDSST
jgi:hypothetical protein